MNPWLQSTLVDLPPSRRPLESPAIPPNVPGEIFRMLVFTGGSRREERAVNWRRLFAIGDGEPCSLSGAVSEGTRTHILKDVHRTDRNDPFYSGDVDPDVERDRDEDESIESNPRLHSLYQILVQYASGHAQVGYVQGMHDIASPVLVTMEGDAAAAYAIFARIMDDHHQASYFEEGGQWTARQLALLSDMLAVADPYLHDRLAFTADNAALFIAYRWLLLLFKREVGLRDAPLFLETIVAAPTERYELFIALAMLLAYRDELLSFGHRFDLTLQFYVSQAGRHDTRLLLSLADQWHQHFSQTASLRHDPRFAPLSRPKGSPS